MIIWTYLNFASLLIFVDSESDLLFDFFLSILLLLFKSLETWQGSILTMLIFSELSFIPKRSPKVETFFDSFWNKFQILELNLLSPVQPWGQTSSQRRLRDESLRLLWFPKRMI